MSSLDLVVLTPLISSGRNQSVPEIRIPSIRGQLRWWLRALYHDPNGLPNTQLEYAVFGGIKGRQFGFQAEPVASSVILRVSHETNLATAVVPLCAHDQHKGQRRAFVAETRFTLHWRWRSPSVAQEIKDAFAKSLETWALLGGLGCRSNRAAGSVWRVDFFDDPLSTGEFTEMLERLNIPANLHVKLLSPPFAAGEAARREACDTIDWAGAGLRVMGNVQGGRLASPLKLKVGKFTDGYRLIAVLDQRPNRLTEQNFQRAIELLRNRRKPLGTMLASP